MKIIETKPEEGSSSLEGNGHHPGLYRVPHRHSSPWSQARTDCVVRLGNTGPSSPAAWIQTQAFFADLPNHLRDLGSSLPLVPPPPATLLHSHLTAGTLPALCTQNIFSTRFQLGWIFEKEDMPYTFRPLTHI